MTVRGQALPSRPQSHTARVVCAGQRSTFIQSRIGTRLSLSLTESPAGPRSGDGECKTSYLDSEASTRGRLSPSW